jgi:hypothetical protein
MSAIQNINISDIEKRKKSMRDSREFALRLSLEPTRNRVWDHFDCWMPRA